MSCDACWAGQSRADQSGPLRRTRRYAGSSSSSSLVPTQAARVVSQGLVLRVCRVMTANENSARAGSERRRLQDPYLKRARSK